MSRSRGGRGRPQDAFGHKAKQEGYPARSVYKLQEIDRRVRLLKQGQRVLDLGAFPGSWSLYAAGRVGGHGHVSGVDIQPHKAALPPNVEMRELDVLDAPLETFGEPGSFDAVLSDMAPATTGHKHVDQTRSFQLFMRALEIARHVLAPGGSFVAKIFQSGDFPEAREAVRVAFTTVRVIRPEAVRTESYEIYVVGLGRRAEAAPPSATPVKSC